MSAPAKPPRLEDVARKAGVSPATVSRYFNNASLLSPATAERIRAAVAEIGYLPNLLAGGLASNRSRLVSVLVPDIAGSIFNDTIEAMVDELCDHGYMPMLGLTRANNSRMAEVVDAALARRPEALILTGTLDDPGLRHRLRNSGATVIETWGLPSDPIDVAVGFSHEAVGRELAQFAIDRGYARPLLVVADSARAKRRRDGFLARWEENGGATPSEVLIPLPNRFAHGRLAFRRLMELPQRPDLVICGSDLLAQSVIIEAQAKGLKVPDELGVIGFGNLAVAGAMRPTITTVEIDGARIGREAVAVLRRRAGGEPVTERKIDVGFRIIARESA